MKIGFVQLNVSFGNPDDNLKKIISLTSDKEADLLVLPDLAISGNLFSDRNKFLDKKISKNSKIILNNFSSSFI